MLGSFDTTWSCNGSDIIGDIHGHAGALKRLLDELGYRKSNGTFHHPEERKVVFLGDFIDRGPAIRETLQIVRSMVDGGTALAVLGDHEYNAVCYETHDGSGDYLRSHTEQSGKNTNQLEATLREFAEDPTEWSGWIGWFKSLPFALELNGFRAAHAAWDESALQILKGKSLRDDSFLPRSADPATEEFRAVETVLKGVEVPLPEGFFFDDKEGYQRDKIRVQWWKPGRSATYCSMVFPDCETVPDLPVEEAALERLSGYSSDECPVFFGHYWLPLDSNLKPVAENAACLDYSVARNGGKLAAYRWNGEMTLTDDAFVSVPAV